MDECYQTYNREIWETMSDLDKMASACATVFLSHNGTQKTAAGLRPWLLGLGALTLGSGAAYGYHQNRIRNAYTEGNRDLMAELRPLIAGLHAPRGGFDLNPQGVGFQ